MNIRGASSSALGLELSVPRADQYHDCTWWWYDTVVNGGENQPLSAPFHVGHPTGHADNPWELSVTQINGHFQSNFSPIPPQAPSIIPFSPRAVPQSGFSIRASPAGALFLSNTVVVACFYLKAKVFAVEIMCYSMSGHENEQELTFF